MSILTTRRVCGDRTFLLLLLTLLMLPFLSAQSKAASICDPQDSLNDQARSFRVKGNLGEARSIVARVLSAHPNDFRARYTDALIDLDEAKLGTPTWDNGLNKLVALSKDVDQEGEACAKSKNYYSIFNTIGAEYYNERQYSQAKAYFVMAAQHREYLDADTSTKLYNNLGLTEFVAHDYVCAQAYFQKASAAGSTSGEAHLKLVNTILNAASDKGTCKTIY